MANVAHWSRLGWQGIAFDVPAEWCPGQLQGDWAGGYLRVEDELSIRLELRWESLRGRRLPDASALVDNFLRQTAKKRRRGEAKPEVVRGRSVPALGAFDHEVFTWRGAFNAHSLLVVCPATARAVHVRVFFEPKDELKSITRRIFASVTTGPHDGQCEWSVFDLAFRLAANWRLETSSLRTGCLQLAFRDGREELEVSRFSLAELVLRKASFEQWFEGAFAKPLKRFRRELDEASYRGHAALWCEGVMRTRSRPLGLLRRKRYLTALAWLCPEADKLFVVRAVADAPDDPRVRECADTVECH